MILSYGTSPLAVQRLFSSFVDVAKLANSGMGEDSDGYRHEFVSLVKTAGTLDSNHSAARQARNAE